MKQIVHISASFEPGNYSASRYHWLIDWESRIIDDMPEDVLTSQVVRPLNRAESVASGLNSGRQARRGRTG